MASPFAVVSPGSGLFSGGYGVHFRYPENVGFPIAWRAVLRAWPGRRVLRMCPGDIAMACVAMARMGAVMGVMVVPSGADEYAFCVVKDRSARAVGMSEH